MELRRSDIRSDVQEIPACLDAGCKRLRTDQETIDVELRLRPVEYDGEMTPLAKRETTPHLRHENTGIGANIEEGLTATG
jgi:hypothetical protein